MRLVRRSVPKKISICIRQNETLTPFGLYNNIKEVGCVAWSPDTPSLYWGPAGLMGMSFLFQTDGLGNFTETFVLAQYNMTSSTRSSYLVGVCLVRTKFKVVGPKLREKPFQRTGQLTSILHTTIEQDFLN